MLPVSFLKFLLESPSSAGKYTIDRAREAKLVIECQVLLPFSHILSVACSYSRIPHCGGAWKDKLPDKKREVSNIPILNTRMKQLLLLLSIPVK